MHSGTLCSLWLASQAKMISMRQTLARAALRSKTQCEYSRLAIPIAHQAPFTSLGAGRNAKAVLATDQSAALGDHLIAVWGREPTCVTDEQGAAKILAESNLSC
jgi:hypothetical protein